MFASIFQTSPVGITYTFDLDKKVALNLQKIAWATHQEYYGN
ncbi:MAG: hypothetical protein Ct9H300mP20_10120 [Gammaproteobacteria bacterium]|nr:MAG: hypothetical protein Ct9H300mP20_10120 [Gammaproteobacteria bacterium]